MRRKCLQIALTVLLIQLAAIGLAGAASAADAGERLSRTCAGCHGTNGASPGKLIPIIGGQHAGYAANVLAEFAADKRPGTVMLKLAKGYPVEQQKQIAAWFADNPWINTPHAENVSSVPTLSKSCQGCHGNSGAGQGAFPRLAGQHPEYLYQALLEYRDGKRTAATMKLVAGMSEDQLRELADYYSALR